MGDVVRSFIAAREHQLKEEKSFIFFKGAAQGRGRQIVETHQNALVEDIAIAVQVETHRDIIGDDNTDRFISLLCELREFYVIKPNEYETSPFMKEFIEYIITNDGNVSIDVGFEHMMRKCETHQISEKLKYYKMSCRVSEAKNTSEAIQFFQQWCKSGEGAEKIINCVKTCMVDGDVENIANQFASNFIEKYIQPSIALIDLNTRKARESFERRSYGNQLEARDMRRSHLRLV